MITDWIVTGCCLFFSLAIGLNIISTAICSWKLTTERKTKCQRGNYWFWFSYMAHIFCCVSLVHTCPDIFSREIFFFAFKILCLHTWCIQIIFALPDKYTLFVHPRKYNSISCKGCTLRCMIFISSSIPPHSCLGGFPNHNSKPLIINNYWMRFVWYLQ